MREYGQEDRDGRGDRALVTFSDAAICGSDGSRMLVASVPVAASPGQHGDLQHGGRRFHRGAGVDRGGLVGHGGFPGIY